MMISNAWTSIFLLKERLSRISCLVSVASGVRCIRSITSYASTGVIYRDDLYQSRGCLLKGLSASCPQAYFLYAFQASTNSVFTESAVVPCSWAAIPEHKTAYNKTSLRAYFGKILMN